VKKKRPKQSAVAKRQRAFLREYARNGGRITAACAKLGFTLDLHRNWLKRPKMYPDYAGAYRQAKKAARRARAQALLDSVFDRAVTGAPRFGKNKDGSLRSEWWSEDTGFVTADDHRYHANPGAFVKRTLVERVPSDVLTMFELKKLLPAYRDKQQVSVTGEVAHTHDASEDVKKLLADRESLDLANTLARRMAINACGNGESSN
jgi:hypothetical protein